jgi:heptosyltransferase-2
MGDVVRTTPILHRIREIHPRGRIFWLSHFTDILPAVVDWPLPFTEASIIWLKSLEFEIGINLDKDPEACALMEQLTVNHKFGFGLNRGMPAPLNQLAEHKFLTGISDALSQANRKHYLEEIFDICGWKYRDEEYVLPEARSNDQIEDYQPTAKVIGLNTGCGGRWTTRLWPEEYWVSLAEELQRLGYAVLLLGGPEEHEKNLRIAHKSGSEYLGVFPILEFLGLMKKCDLIVTAVTMAMHFAVGLKIPLVLFNNIFNPHEFHFFTPSVILSPDRPCECYYRAECTYERSCMYDLSVTTVLEAVRKLVPA